MKTLENRIAALEVKTITPEALTIIRRFVTPGKPLAEIECLKDGQGTEWKRQPGETEQGLIDRASLEVSRNSFGMARFFGMSR